METKAKAMHSLECALNIILPPVISSFVTLVISIYDNKGIVFMELTNMRGVQKVLRSTKKETR